MLELAKKLDEFWCGVRRWDDEPVSRQGAIEIEQWPYNVWPRAEEYRIVDRELEGAHRYGLEARPNGDWVEVLCYDNGCDTYGKLHSGRWVPMRTRCRWSLSTLRRLKNTLLELPQPKVVVE